MMAPLMMPISEKYKDLGTVAVGKIESGHVRKGDSLILMPNRVSVEVAAMYNEMEDEMNMAVSGDNVRIRLRGVDDEDLSPGFVLTSPAKPVHAVEAMSMNESWLTEQDIPHPIIPRAANKGSPRLSPKVSRRPSILSSPLTSPTVRLNLSSRASQLTLSGDDLFVMDDVPALNLDTPGGDASAPGSPWRKTTCAPRVDMKIILAEAGASKLAANGSPSLPKQPSRDRMQTQSINIPVQRPSGSPAISRQAGRVSCCRGSIRSCNTSSRARGAFPVSRSSEREHQRSVAAVASRAWSYYHTGEAESLKAWHTIDTACSAACGPSPPVQPVVQPSGPAPSFVAIQHAQEQQDNASTKDVRSLMEIQAEEQSRREEEAFLKWWAAEEERIRLEESGVAAVPAKPQRAAAQEDEVRFETQGEERGEGEGAECTRRRAERHAQATPEQKP
ncbi:hypothetical protein EWM64_g8925 [Hericium alpestre]|uniref:Translation elongation factor EFTu-like domain-containing protein n=1 Tax=Hericium alpestre TaxID=135208 RepID=A0A4Y9ZJV9_9AGAM|nr:hypothetical protein EWM64_g8925 [Hericium alpestre]